MSQLLRLIKNGDEKTLRHVDYWIGEVLGEFHADFGHGVCSLNIPGFFATLGEIIAESRISNSLSGSNWKFMSNKILYRQQIMSLPLTKVERDIGSTLTDSWRRMNMPVISSSIKEVLFLTIHDKLPVRERLYRIQVANDLYCPECFNVVGMSY